jgi:hypothetical protein
MHAGLARVTFVAAVPCLPPIAHTLYCASFHQGSSARELLLSGRMSGTCTNRPCAVQQLGE